MKRIICIMLTALLLVMVFPVAAMAADAPEFLFDITSSGEHSRVVASGDVITVEFTLKRTDKDEAYTLYSMQNEIRYDSEFFEFVEGSAILKDGARSEVVSLTDSKYKDVYINRLAMGTNGETAFYGESWQPTALVGTFRLRVKAQSGSSVIKCEDYIVSHSDGNGGYTSVGSEINVTIGESCTVKFESSGGSKLSDVNVKKGEKLAEPAAPIREGYTFAGWYSDVNLRNRWDFSRDVVSSDMTLYAKWIKNGEKPSGGESIVISGDKKPESNPNTGAESLIASAAVLAVCSLAALAVLSVKKH